MRDESTARLLRKIYQEISVGNAAIRDGQKKILHELQILKQDISSNTPCSSEYSSLQELQKFTPVSTERELMENERIFLSKDVDDVKRKIVMVSKSYNLP